MKSKNSIIKKRVEHRGYDSEATRNYNLEIQVVKEFNAGQPDEKETKKQDRRIDESEK